MTEIQKKRKIENKIEVKLSDAGQVEYEFNGEPHHLVSMLVTAMQNPQVRNVVELAMELVDEVESPKFVQKRTES